MSLADLRAPAIVLMEPVKAGRTVAGRNSWETGRFGVLAGMILAIFSGAQAIAETRFAVTLPDAVSESPITGRLIVIAADTETDEPRNAIGMYGPPMFGIDVEGIEPGGTMIIDSATNGYPVDLRDLPPGDYNVQAVLIRYTEVHRADGHTIRVPVTNRRTFSLMLPGNLYSRTEEVRIDPGSAEAVALTLTETVGPVPEREETAWIKHVRIKSEILSDFWGVPMYLGASVLLPKEFDEYPEVRYPAAYVLGHGDAPFGFEDDPASETENAKARAADANLTTGYQFAQEWMSDDFPRMVAITFEHPSPYFVESYALNSANNGPYGDAITRELLPYLEKTFRLIPEPYARIVEGASTGGWEALALQLHYPDLFGGAWVFNPDPIDFTRYQHVNIYEDDNMFAVPLNDWLRAERPFRRSREGQPMLSVRELADLESVLGSRGRSFYQLDIWQATHGPVGEDGYPVLLFDKHTGVINHDVADYMRQHGYDLSAYFRDNWPTLGPKLRGKLNLFSGEMDDFFLNLAVYEFEAMVVEVAGADYPIRFEYGRPKKGHNWHHKDWAGVVREMATHVEMTAPEGANTEQWRY